MNKERKGFSRREMLGMAIGAGGLTFYLDSASVFARLPTEAVFTPSIILGPFYPQIKLSEQDPDLTVLAGRQKRAPKFHVEMRLSSRPDRETIQM